MTEDSNTLPLDPVAASIKEALKDATNAVVQINPTIQAVPAHIAGNLLVFLQRTPCTGLEAIGWVEAFQYLQQFAPPPAPAGVPFTGLPAKKA
jgi:hypothetical protein